LKIVDHYSLMVILPRFKAIINQLNEPRKNVMRGDQRELRQLRLRNKTMRNGRRSCRYGTECGSFAAIAEVGMMFRQPVPYE
jgi:hypothetical protein